MLRHVLFKHLKDLQRHGIEGQMQGWDYELELNLRKLSAVTGGTLACTHMSGKGIDSKIGCNFGFLLRLSLQTAFSFNMLKWCASLRWQEY